MVASLGKNDFDRCVCVWRFLGLKDRQIREKKIEIQRRFFCRLDLGLIPAGPAVIVTCQGRGRICTRIKVAHTEAGRASCRAGPHGCHA